MIHSATPEGQPLGGRPPISLVVVNARIWTGRPGRPWADALAVSGDRLAAVGSSAEIRKLAGAAARVVDARGALLVPGADGDPRPAAASVIAAAADGPGTEDGAGPRLVVGGPADFTLLDRDVTRLPPAGLSEARVVLTMAGGEIVANWPS